MDDEQLQLVDQRLLELHGIGLARKPGDHWPSGLVAVYFVEMATSDTHGVMVGEQGSLEEVVRMGIGAWPNTDLICRADGTPPTTAVVTAEYAKTLTAKAARNWRRKTVAWRGFPGEVDAAFTAFVRHHLRADRVPEAEALSALRSMPDTTLFDA